MDDTYKARRDSPRKHGRDRSRSPDELDTGSRSFHPSQSQSHRNSSQHHSSSHHHHRSHRDTHSPKRSRHHDGEKRSSKKEESEEVKELPCDAPHISTRHYGFYESLFASYLDVQKGISLDELDEREKKGRFKSFVKHWNRGELASGWYDPDRKSKCDAMRAEILGDAPPAEEEEEGGRARKKRRASPVYDSRAWSPPPARSERSRRGLDEPEERQIVRQQQKNESESDEDEFGPWIPGQERKKMQVALPTSADLDAQSESIRDAHRLEQADLKFNRKLDRKAQKEALDELAPRADAGTRERQIEKKKEVNSVMREFRNKSPGAELEVAESTLMGDAPEEGFKAKKAAMERKKNERELRKEAMLRQRIQEREERLEEARKKEEKTMGMLRALRDNMLQKGGR